VLHESINYHRISENVVSFIISDNLILRSVLKAYIRNGVDCYVKLDEPIRQTTARARKTIKIVFLVRK